RTPREQGKSLISQILEAGDLAAAKAAAAKLKALGQPFLSWSGKAERLSFDVPTLPLFVHERLSTKAIVESLSAHLKPGRQRQTFDLYRDTWEVGIHSYLTCLRDRLLLCRDLLHPRGSIFVQISDENVHLVRGLLAEVFGREHFAEIVNVAKTSGLS